MNVFFHKNFEKLFAKLPRSFREQAIARITLFRSEPFHPLLNNHRLSGEYNGCRSINVTGDYRAVYRHEGSDSVRFVNIGTHSQLYGK